MLARRFTIVCVLMALFGMLFSILVAQTSRNGHSRKNATIISCSMGNATACARQAG